MDTASALFVFKVIKETVNLAPDVLNLIKGVEEGAIVTKKDVEEILNNQKEIDGAVDEFMKD